MSNLTDRTAYLRGLADGLGLDKEKKETRLLTEMLNVMDEMAQKISGMDDKVEELSDYMEELDSDLGDVEDVLFGDGEDDCDCCHCEDDDEDEDDDDGELEELSFDCPHCGKTVMLKASDIDYDQSPVCQHCGKPFFIDVTDDPE